MLSVRRSILLLALFAASALHAQEPKGQRVYSAGHSFHYFMPNILKEIALSAGVKHVVAGQHPIGGSQVIKHWEKDGDKNKVKQALADKSVDVLTLAPIYLPDAGIENFAKLALEHNPDIRVTIQEFWLPFDYLPEAPRSLRGPKEKIDHNKATSESMRKAHNEYFKEMDEHVTQLNKKLGKSVLTVAPVGQAVVALREKIIKGEAPGLEKQSDLFTDAIGHAKPPLMVLVAYVHFAQIYGKSPVGLPVPSAIKSSDKDGKLNRLLQELAWQAVTEHPLSGVSAK